LIIQKNNDEIDRFIFLLTIRRAYAHETVAEKHHEIDSRATIYVRLRDGRAVDFVILTQLNINRDARKPLYEVTSGYKEGSKAFNRYRQIDEDMKKEHSKGYNPLFLKTIQWLTI
jgi:hypothetical protein